MFCLPDSDLELLSETPRVLLLLDYFQECLLALSLGALLRSDFTSYLSVPHIRDIDVLRFTRCLN